LAKEDVLKFEGEVIEVLGNSMFRVKLENDHEVIAYIGGKMRKFSIKIILGDRVEVEMTPYDLSKARIVYRQK
jgi:translation initiation factor IF-1